METSQKAAAKEWNAWGNIPPVRLEASDGARRNL